MEDAEKTAMFEVTLLPEAEETFRKLDKPVQARIGQKIDWLSENASAIVHHPLTSLPKISADYAEYGLVITGLSTGYIRKRNIFRYMLSSIGAKTTNP